MGFNQNSTFGFGGGGSGGGGGTVNDANNGTSLVGGTTVVLGQAIGDPANPAELISSVEIPLAGNTVDFSDTGGTVQVAANAVNFTGEGVVANTTGAQGITLHADGKVEISPLPAPGISDPEIFTQVTGNTKVGGWLLNQVRVNASQDDATATAEDSGTMYVKVFDGFAVDRTITLPPAVPGLIFHFSYSGNGTVFINVVPDGTDFIWFGINSALPTVAGGGIKNNNAGAITLLCIVAGEWQNISQISNTWAPL